MTSKSLKLIFFKGSKANRDAFKNHGTKDFVFIVGGKELKIHKNILKQWSAVFSSRFEVDPEENSFEVEGFDYPTIKTIVNLCYGVTPKCPISAEQCIKLLNFTIAFEMEYIKKFIKETIVLTSSNVNEFKKFAVEKNWNEFVDECNEFLDLSSQHTFFIQDSESIDGDSMHLRQNLATSEISEAAIPKIAEQKCGNEHRIFEHKTDVS